MPSAIPPPPPLFDLLPELRELAVIAQELEVADGSHPEPDPFGTRLGFVAWPSQETWPWMEPDESTFAEWQEWCESGLSEKMPVPQPFFPLLQLRKQDAPTLAFPEGTDLLQILWHVYDYQFTPTAVVRWRVRAALHELASPPAPIDLGSWQKNFCPPQLPLKHHNSWVLPDIRTTSLDTIRAVARVDREVDRLSDAYRERQREREARHIGTVLNERSVKLMSQASGPIEPKDFMAQAKQLMEDLRAVGPLPVAEEPPPPQGYLELGCAKGIRVGVDGMCPQLFIYGLPRATWRHLLTIGEEAWPGAQCVVPSGGGNVHIFVGDDGHSAHVWVDNWSGVVGSVLAYLDTMP